MKPELHPWASTSAAMRACGQAAKIPMNLLFSKAESIGYDELVSEAYAILIECALPPREQLHTGCAFCGASLEGLRANAKFCSKLHKDLYGKKVERGKVKVLNAQPKTHVGSMWSWPESQMTQYAVREIGYALNNWVRKQRSTIEIPASEQYMFENAQEVDLESDGLEVVQDWLEQHGVMTTGNESFEDLMTAINLVKESL